jgi:hypothetical protein
MDIMNDLETQPIPLDEEERRHTRRLLVGVLCALLLTGIVLGGYVFLRKRHERQVAAAAEVENKKKVTKVEVLVDDAMIEGKTTTLGGSIRNLLPISLSNSSSGVAKAAALSFAPLTRKLKTSRRAPPRVTACKWPRRITSPRLSFESSEDATARRFLSELSRETSGHRWMRLPRKRLWSEISAGPLARTNSSTPQTIRGAFLNHRQIL